MKTFFNKDVEQTLKETNSKVEGLTSSEAEKRLQEYGENVLPKKKPKSKLLRFLSQFADVDYYFVCCGNDFNCYRNSRKRIFRNG